MISIPTQNQHTFPLLQRKEIGVTSLIAAVCLALFFLFPSEGVLENVTKSVLFLFMLPFFYITLVLKRSVVEFGFSLKNTGTGIVWGGTLLALSLLILALIIKFTPFQTQYTVPTGIGENFWVFLLYEFIIASALFFFQEFFFKGFFLFTFREKLGGWSIILSFGLFLGILMLAKNLDWQRVPFIITSLTGAIVAYKSRSFLYAYLMEIIFFAITDSYIIYTLNRL